MAAGRLVLGAHERRVARRLEARGLPGLGNELAKLCGREIAGRWKLDELYAVGAEGAVYTATRLAGSVRSDVVVKIPLLPFHRPAELSSSLLRHRRDALREEARHLTKSASPYMPTSQGLHEFENPLLDKNRGGAFEEPDPALVMERLGGIDVDLWLARVHRSRMPKQGLRPHLDQIGVVLLHALRDLNERGFFYADLRPGNLRVIGRPLRSVRLLDAGSLVAVDDQSGKFPHVPHYLPPALFEARYMRGGPITPSPAVQAIMAGRTLYEVATGCVPVPGRPLDFGELKLARTSPLLADVVDGLASGSFSSVVAAIKYLTKKTAPPQPAAAAPAPSATPAPTGAPARPAAAPVVRPQPGPAVRPQSTPVVRPQPTHVVRPQPTPVVRPQPTPVVRPQPAPAARPQTAPPARPHPAPAVRPAPAPATTHRPAPAPTPAMAQRPTPRPAPTRAPTKPLQTTAVVARPVAKAKRRGWLRKLIDRVSGSKPRNTPPGEPRRWIRV
jgi:hypothetical protein